MAKTTHWGILPKDAIAQLRKKEWDHLRHLKQRLRQQRPFPIVISLKAPTGEQASNNLDHFHALFKEWKGFAYPDLVRWQQRQFKQLSTQNVPVKLIIPTLDILVELLGEQQRFKKISDKISYLLQQPFVQLNVEYVMFSTLIEYLEQVEQYNEEDWRLLIQLIPQLKPNMGAGHYLRALPLKYVDTKFLEKNLVLIEAICDVLHLGTVQATGGLLTWLNCLDHPKGWLMVKPLCTHVQQSLGNLPIFQLSIDVLIQFELPAEHIIVIENIQSGLAFPALENSIVVCGGGKNIKWLDAIWLQQKQVYYWGDIDSEGLTILSMVRHKIPSVIALMMDQETVLQFQDQMVDEPDSVFSEPQNLSIEELTLFHALRNQRYKNKRLEQERITNEWICIYLKKLGLIKK
ncbi:Wadjet anti-phage system protein JetD domain-containing protein [Acinetobacter soli]|uniref:Wadjet anti-phage system protein JetD domain-containing protein n=1 Tax=Acinetobacter soli TaxID=487316 RepID=UPI0030177B2D